MATIKKACKGVSYPKSSSVSKRLGSPSKAKSGGSFPDLNKDGKVTKKDILIGKGVLPKTAKKGMKVKKAQDGAVTKTFYQKSKGYPDDKKILGTRSVDTTGYAGGKKDFTMKQTGTEKPLKQGNTSWDASRKEVKKFLKEGPEIQIHKKGGTVKKTMKMGGKMTKKCAYGCK